MFIDYLKKKTFEEFNINRLIQEARNEGTNEGK